MPYSIALQASKAPQAIAIVDDTMVLTYAELAHRSKSLALRLVAMGIDRDCAVAVCVPRCAEQIVAALAIMRCGAAYLPLDPQLPVERIRFIVHHAQATLALYAESAGFEPPLDLSPIRALSLSSPVVVDDCVRGPSSILDGARSADLAYIMYTSGSTGQPKGVEITHAGLSNLVAWHRSAFDVRPDDRASHLAAVGFDAAAWEVWPYLCAGAAVYVAGDPIARDPRALRDWLIWRGITIGFAATPIAERLIDLDFPADTALRVLLTGADTLRRYPRAGLPFALYNNYGPTEATVVATSGRVDAATAATGALPSIGRPIDNTLIAILDGAGVSVADGASGEICIAGSGLARGYRGRGDLTAERFVWYSTGDGSPVRFYRTGDRGRREPDGTIGFLGRIDEQINIRGLRIEPREIEIALTAAESAIRECAVVAREFAPGDERLVAFVVTASGERIVPDDLRRRLAARLPTYMLPAAFAELTSLPLTSNGKVDRTALQTREIELAETGTRHNAPRTATERRIMHIVASLLKLDRISVDDDFFLLGGHSLLGTQLIARMRDAFGVRIGLRLLFDSPTIGALAAEVDRQLLATASSDAEPTQPVERTAVVHERRA